MKVFTFSASKKKVFSAAKSSLLFFLFVTSYFVSAAQVPGMAKLSVQLLLNLNGGSHNTADGLVAVFAPGFSAGIGNEDSYKFTNIDENMAINRNGTSLSIEGRPTIVANDTLPLKMWKFRQKTYCIKLDGSNFSSSLTAVVKDAYLKQDFTINLAGSTIAAFDITTDSASFAANRFCIVFKEAAAASLLPVTFSNVKAYTKDKGVQIDWTMRTQTGIEGFEVERSVTGIKFDKIATVPAKGSNAEQNYNWYDANVTAGNNFYRIKTTEKSGVVKYSGVLKVTTEKTGSGFTIFPNPVKGNVVGLHINGMEKGRYMIHLYNSQGQKIYDGLIDHNGGSATQSFTINKKISGGMYMLQLNKDGMSTNQTVLFQ